MNEIISRIKNSAVIYAIRRGLVLSIPLLMIGSFSLVFKFLPIDIYQRFIKSFANGFLIEAFTAINQVSFGILAVVITCIISASYAKLKTNKFGQIMSVMFASLASFLILVGLFTDEFNVTSFGASGVYTAIFSSIVFGHICLKLSLSERFTRKTYSVGADSDFNTVMSVSIPIGISIGLAFLLNFCINKFFGVASLDDLFQKCVIAIFTLINGSSPRIIAYVALSGFFWFFGIHGTNVLFVVEDLVFGTEMGIITKKFIDVFVFMGGCGATISLLIAILLFGKIKTNRNLAKTAALPMLFNINELMIFGYPVVLNVYLFIPFIAVPLVFIAMGYVAIFLGMVPQPVNDVSWVSPIIINGYQATGSIRGSLLQIVEIAVGMVIYRHFIVKYEKDTSSRLLENLNELIDMLKDAENKGENIKLLELEGEVGGVANILAEDLKHIVKIPDSLMLYYQPQYNEDDVCVGAEALLRWNHPRCGMIYPPLLINIAKEVNVLDDLERNIFLMACKDIEKLKKEGSCPKKISVNATATTLNDMKFLEFLKDLIFEYPDIKDVLYVELTEQMSFLLSESSSEMFKELHELGFRFAIDDFSMGHSSIKYLQSNIFSLVKIDGSMIKDILTNKRGQEIILSIVYMSKTMDFDLIAEFVETKEQKDKLASLGCFCYQGYYYSPAIPLEEFSNISTKKIKK